MAIESDRLYGVNQPRHPDSQLATISTPGAGAKDLDDAQWKSRLTEQQYFVLRQKGTDAKGEGVYVTHFEPGRYFCSGCDSLLYTSEHKFLCGCGWPGFWTNVKDAVREQPDKDTIRMELICHSCTGHLGHVLRGEQFTNPVPNERHCVNSTAVRFEVDQAIPVGPPKKKEEAAGGGVEEKKTFVNNDDTLEKVPLSDSAKVVVFSIADCPYCAKAKQLLQSRGVGEGDGYKVYALDGAAPLSNSDAVWGALAKNFNHETMPAIFVNGEFLGGFSELKAKDESGELTKLLVVV